MRKLTDAATGKQILVRLDDVQAITETPEGIKPEGRRVYIRGSVITVRETAEELEKIFLDIEQEAKRKEREVELFARSLGDKMVDAASGKGQSSEETTLPKAQVSSGVQTILPVGKASARRVTEEGLIESGLGKSFARVGDYVITTKEGFSFVMTPEKFQQEFSIVSE